MDKIIKLSTTEHHPTSLEEGLVVDAVEKKYRKKTVLRGISMQIKKGEVVGLLGPNGCWQDNQLLYNGRVSTS